MPTGTKPTVRPPAEFRIEHDSMGEVRVPASAKWAAQTQRAVENFPISGRPIERELIRGLALIKGFGARVRAERGLLDADKAAAISAVALDVAGGDWDAEFPIDVFQTGSGTSSNMNANEVIATLASERLGGVTVHPNDDVNDPLSSNDQFPSAIHIAATNAVVNDLIPALRVLHASLAAKAGQFASVVKSGRTHLMDATPVTLGQVISGWVAQLDDAREVIEAARDRLYPLALGGTAVGTGLNAHPKFGDAVAAAIARETGKPFVEAPNKFAALSAHDAIVNASAAVRTRKRKASQRFPQAPGRM